MEAGKLRKGNIFRYEGVAFVVVEYEHVKQARQAGFVNVKVKNVETGGVKLLRLNPGENVEEVDLTFKQMQFSYDDGGLYYFMDPETCDLIPVDASMVGDALLYNNDANETVYTFQYLDGKLINIEPQTFVVLEVIETDPAVAGDTARSALKNAKLESGLEIKVQMFINIGDKVKVDTRTGEYVERV